MSVLLNEPLNGASWSAFTWSNWPERFDAFTGPHHTITSNIYWNDAVNVQPASSLQTLIIFCLHNTRFCCLYKKHTRVGAKLKTLLINCWRVRNNTEERTTSALCPGSELRHCASHRTWMSWISKSGKRVKCWKGQRIHTQGYSIDSCRCSNVWVQVRLYANSELSAVRRVRTLCWQLLSRTIDTTSERELTWTLQVVFIFHTGGRWALYLMTKRCWLSLANGLAIYSLAHYTL